MKFEDVLSYRFEDRGFGNCAIWVNVNEYEITPNGVQKRETVLNAEGLFGRIRNLRRQGLDTSFEEWALAEVIMLDFHVHFLNQRHIEPVRRAIGLACHQGDFGLESAG